MSKQNSGTKSGAYADQQTETGYSSYNFNPAQDLYDREFNGITAGLSDVQENGKQIINDNADSPTANTDALRGKESLGTPRHTGSSTASTSKPAKAWQLLTSKKLRGKTSLITVALVLFGGGGAISIFASPSLAIVQLRQVLTQDLNDQLHAFENRHAYLMRTKLKTTTNGSCGVVKIACRFSTVSNRQVERFARGGITVERAPGTSLLPGRDRIQRMTFPNPDGDPFVANTPEELRKLMLNEPAVRSAMQRAENPWFASMTDKTFKKALLKLGTSKKSRIQGDTNEEREKSVNNAIKQTSDVNTRNLTPEVEDGKETGRFIGPDGEVLTQAEIDAMDEQSRIADGATKTKPSAIISSIGKGVMITGAVDSACSVYNAMRLAGAMAKSEKAMLAAQMVMPSLLVPADKILAGVATDGETEFVGNKINNIGGPEQPDEVVDESRIYDAGSTENAPTKENDKRYETAFDSPGVKAALHGDVIPLDSQHARFSLAGGFIGTLAKVNSFIAMAVSGGNPDPKVISSKCKYVQNPYVRGAALVAGVIAGIGTFGLAQAAGISASLAISMALPYAMSLAADILAGDVFTNLYGSDFGSGTFVGTAAIMSTAAQQRGMKPLSAEEAVAYTSATSETLARYAETERNLAKSDPFNIYNQYSFLGSLAYSVTPQVIGARSSAFAMATSITNIVPTAFASFAKPAKAATVERFQQCEDPMYKALGIGADMYCNVRFGLSEEELAMDPVDNANWMAQNGHISADDETGEPIENDQPWNYQKFMKECVNRTVGYGEDQDENEGDGSNCISKENEAANQHFRIFTMDRGVADYMDGIDEVDTTASTGSNGPVSADGWAYPTTPDAAVTSTYKDSGRSDDHRGIDLAQPGGAMGKPIFAAYDGKVVASGPASGFGNWIVIEHDVDGRKLSSVYGHMSATDLMVKTGDTVKAGQQISRIGNEGQSSGAHLHFEIWNGNRLQCGGDCSIDPLPIIEKAKQSSGSGNERRV